MSADFINPMLGVPLVESPFFDRLLAQLDVDDETRRIATDLHENGVAVFDFPEPDFDRLATDIVTSLDGKYDWEPWRARHESIRLMDEWRHHEGVHRLAVNARVLSLLRTLYGRRPIPFQTLNFPVGTQQAHHSDCVHFHCVPERFMCGVWIALEDIDDDNGPLSYFPGSHRLPVYGHEHLGSYAPGDQLLYEPMWRALVEAHGLTEQRIPMKRGQAAIWAANLLHGGAVQNDFARTRHSQVTHYYFENCAYYMPHHSDPTAGVIRFKEVIDITTGKVEPNRCVFDEVPASFIAATTPPPGYCASRHDAHDYYLPDDFDGEAYLAANPDVAAAGVGAAYHYKRFGRFEGRLLRPPV